MPEWLTNLTSTSVDPSVPVLASRLLLAWLSGWIIAVLARRRSPSGTVDTLTLTLVLMSVLIAMATQIIGDNIARAFSLVGALSIVRFRTAVPATRDVAFVLAAVVVGMAVGAGQYWVTALGLIVIALVTQFNAPAPTDKKVEKPQSPDSTNWRLAVQVGLSPQDNLQNVLQSYTDAADLLSAETIRRGGALEFSYRIQFKPDVDAAQLIAALNSTPGVESVALKKA